MKELQIEFLNYFNDVAVGEPKSISPFIVKHFKKPITNNYQKWSFQNQPINNLLDDLKFHEFIVAVGRLENGDRNFGARQVSDQYSFIWYDEIEFLWYKTIKADDYLNNFKLNKSITDVNFSIAENNLIISKNSDIQTKAITKQTYLFIATAIFTFFSLTISCINYFNDRSKEQLKQQISYRTKQVDSLKNELHIKNNNLQELLKFKKGTK